MVTQTKRLVALDVLRGLTIALMIMVNNPGSWEYVYAPLRHSDWNGCTPTDLVFPFFLFIVGVSMWYSFKKYGEGYSKDGLTKIVKRTSIIFLLGLFLNAFPNFDFENLRVMGVLQRIALAYGIGATLCMFFNLKQLKYIFTGILLGYWGLIYFGGTGDVFGLTDNAVRQFDLILFGENHVYGGYGIPFDPEGLLSTIPAVGTVLIGYFAGHSIEVSANTMTSIKKLVMFGAVAVAIGVLWEPLFPINKPIWSSSYVIYTGGLAMLFLALLLWVIDVKGIKKWSNPFIHFGTNPLFIYMFSGVYVGAIIYLVKIKTASGETLSGYTYLYEYVFVPIAGNMNGSLLFAVSHIIVFWLITYVLYKKRIFIKI